MAPILRNTQKSYRSCILYEVQLGRSIEEAYRNFCDNTKNNELDYIQFEYWFNSFAHENIDLEDERLDKNKPKSFSDLPMEILGEIVGKLDLMSQLRTRKVSRFLRTVVDKQNARYDEIKIHIHCNFISIQIDNNQVILCLKKAFEFFTVYKRGKPSELMEGDVVDFALNNLTIALKKPKLEVEKLVFTLEAIEYDERFIKFCESLISPIHVKSVSIGNHRCERNIVPILSMLKPGTLESIYIGHWKTEANARRIVEMDQWKQAKRIILTYGNKIPSGIKDLLHFDRVQCQLETISPADVILLRDAFAKSSSFEHWSTGVWELDSTALANIGTALGATVQQDAYGSEFIRHRHPIPGSNEFLSFKFDIHCFSIKRKF